MPFTWLDGLMGRTRFSPSEEQHAAERRLREMDERINALEQQVLVIRLGMLRGRSSADRQSA